MLVKTNNLEFKKEVVTSTESGNKGLYYGWIRDKYRDVLHLGKMKKAVVINRHINDEYFKIAHASFFPFPDEIYNTKYTTIEEARNVASAYVLGWINDTNLALKISE